MVYLQKLIDEIYLLQNPAKAKDYQWFFKTGPGQYGEGDKFLGIIMPKIRFLVKFYWNVIDLDDAVTLLRNPFHEIRMFALLVLAKKYSSDPKKILNIYLKNTQYINNWDLVDLSARDIVGRYCYENKNCSTIYKLSQSSNLWEKRISLISTFYFIKNNQYSLALELCRQFLSDPHDLIHKATGWVLREIGKKDQTILLNFLNANTLIMPRTALRYSIEKFPEDLRQHYLHLR
jgi:3-methyladenine DNA glycosylase AlkD